MKKAICMSLFLGALIMSAGNLQGQETAKQTRNVSGFTEISFGISGGLFVKTGPDFSVTLEGNKNYLDNIETIIRNGRLVIRLENYSRLFNNEKANVYITLPELKGLGVSGSGTAQVENSLRTAALDLSVSGSGKIIIPEVVTGKLECSVSGSGNILLKGSSVIDMGEINISGSGSYSGNEAVFKSLQVGISGSGNCSCNVTESLNASISGSGNVNYSGNPKINARISGSGHVRSTR